METNETVNDWETRGVRWRHFGSAWRRQRLPESRLSAFDGVARPPAIFFPEAQDAIRERVRQLRGATAPPELPSASSLAFRPAATVESTSELASSSAREFAYSSSGEESGSPVASLPPRFQQHLERFLRLRLPRIEIHTSAAADHLARRTGADAVTSRNAIYFRKGAFDPQSREGMALLAHEATHIAWDQGARPSMAQVSHDVPGEEHVALTNERRYLSDRASVPLAPPASTLSSPSRPEPASAQPFVKAAMSARDLHESSAEPASQGAQLSPAALRALEDGLFDALLDRLRSEFERGA